ncbi:MAG: hypothetical protein K2Y56_13820 [Methylobacterium sp.]|uniref:hypothetical protein n=1 Tax=Methylobacterium sp. TaxID=409 RepID=UPI0025E70691|nr:hypothetical protein [Methylobacterium sp.]MBX9932595.1 hypothetical protein [Methylobacterium sp.]
MAARHFPTPWIAVETESGFRIEDADGAEIASTRFGEGEAPSPMSREEAHRIAKAVAMIPEMRTIIKTLQEGLAEAEDEAPPA